MSNFNSINDKVYFSASFYGHDDYEKVGREIKLNKSFICNGRNFIIPSIYLFDEGVVVDVCYYIEVQEIREYIKNIDNILDLFSDDSDENDPFEADFCLDLNINGVKLISSDEYCGDSYNPLEKSISENSEFDFMAHYNLDKSKGWSVTRSAFEWNGNADFDIKTVGINIASDQINVPVLEFTSQDIGKSIEFTNPNTNEIHTLKIIDSAFTVFSENDRKKYGLNMKFGHQLWYEITPSLSYDDYFVTQIFKKKPFNSENCCASYFEIKNNKTYNENTKTCFAFKEYMNEVAKWTLYTFSDKFEDCYIEVHL